MKIEIVINADSPESFNAALAELLRHSEEFGADSPVEMAGWKNGNWDVTMYSVEQTS